MDKVKIPIKTKRHDLSFEKTSQLNWVFGAEIEVAKVGPLPIVCKKARIYMPYFKKIGSFCNTTYNCASCPFVMRTENIDHSILARSLVYPNEIESPMTFINHGITEIEDDTSIAPEGAEIKLGGHIYHGPQIPFYMFKNICERINNIGLDGNQYCGCHYHILVPYARNYPINQYPFQPFFLYNYLYLSSFAAPLLFALAFDKVPRYSIFKENIYIVRPTLNSAVMTILDNSPHRGKYLAFTPYLSKRICDEITSPHFEIRYMETILSPDYLIIHLIANMAIIKHVQMMPPDMVYNANNETYKKAIALMTKINNRGIGHRVSYLDITKEFDEINEIRDTFLGEIENTMKTIDKKGNAFNEIATKRHALELQYCNKNTMLKHVAAIRPIIKSKGRIFEEEEERDNDDEIEEDNNWFDFSNANSR